MKVFVLNQAKNESYLLTFPKEVTSKDVKDILVGGHHGAVTSHLMRKSDKRILVPPKARQKVQFSADFALTQGYSVERLA